MSEYMTPDEAIAWMENGGEVFQMVLRRKPSVYDKFFYRIKEEGMICRVNEMGGWHKCVGSIESFQLNKNLQKSLDPADYDYDYTNGKMIITKLKLNRKVNDEKLPIRTPNLDGAV